VEAVAIGQPWISRRALFWRAAPGLGLSLVGWLIGAYTDHLRLSACIVTSGSMVLVSCYLSISSDDRRDYIAVTAVMVSLLMFKAYLLSAAGINAGAFNRNAPYTIISLIYLSVPSALLICGSLQGKHPIADYLARGLLALVIILGVFIDIALIQLALEVSSIFIEHFQTSSLKHYYNCVLFGEIVVASLALIAVLVRFFWLTLPVVRIS
jgi:hypothetical protein